MLAALKRDSDWSDRIRQPISPRGNTGSLALNGQAHVSSPSGSDGNLGASPPNHGTSMMFMDDAFAMFVR